MSPVKSFIIYKAWFAHVKLGAVVVSGLQTAIGECPSIALWVTSLFCTVYKHLMHIKTVYNEEMSTSK